MDKLTINTASAVQTQDLGRWIGQRLEPGSIIALIGDLGCGKTCFTQGLCSGLDISTRYVNSPTFTFINEYSGRLPVLHFDLYRVEDMDTVLEIGALDSLSRAEQGVAVIEWAERVSRWERDSSACWESWRRDENSGPRHFESHECCWADQR
jgi:tRNA threonylcarbamoyladenosine biosynthesis protein TsaE